MALKRVSPKVLIVPPPLVLELFALARYAGSVGQHSCAIRMLLALRRLRPDVPEFSSYAALSMIEEGHLDEAKDLLEEYLDSGFDECSFVLSLLAYVRYNTNDPRWTSTARRAQDVALVDGGGASQRQVLSVLPMDSLGIS